MRKFTKRQKKMLRSMAVGLSFCIVLALTLSITAILNTRQAVPVRFSDIHEAASVTASEQTDGQPEKTQDSEYLYETMYPTELLTQATTSAASTTEQDMAGAGGTLLINTTETASEAEPVIITDENDDEQPETAATTVPPQTTTVPSSAVTTTTTVKTTAATTKAVTTTAKTTAHTSRTPFINIGGGVVSDDDSIYIKMLSLVNKARKKNGLKELWYSARVHEVARLRAVELSSYYSHDRPDGKGFYTAFADVGVKYRHAGENIAYGRNMFETPEEVFDAWMDSPSHRENILSPNYECAAFGLSVLKVGNDTYYYWSQEFAAF